VLVGHASVPYRMVQPMEVQFQRQTGVGSRNRLLDGVHVGAIQQV